MTLTTAVLSQWWLRLMLLCLSLKHLTFPTTQASHDQRIADLRAKRSAQQQQRLRGVSSLDSYRGPAAEADPTAAVPLQHPRSVPGLVWDTHRELIDLQFGYDATQWNQGNTAVLLSAALAVAQCGLLSWLFFSTGNIAPAGYLLKSTHYVPGYR